MAGPVMRRARGDGVEMQLAVWEGEGKEILCIHGLTANCRCWDVIAKKMAPENRIIAVDLRGRGLSDKPPRGYSEEHHLRDIHSLMNDMGLEKSVLMGHSLGAYVSLVFAARYPERVEGLILIDAGGDLKQDQWDKIALFIKPSIERLGQIYPSFESCAEIMKQNPVFQPWTEELDVFLRHDVEEVEGGVRSRIRPENIQEELTNKRQTGAAQFYPGVRCPVLVLRATDGILSDDDLVLPDYAVGRMLREISNVRCENIKGTNHYSIVFQPNNLRDNAIRQFLEGLN